MKLKPILIPTEDASIIYLQYDLLRIGKYMVESKGEESNQHLYLVSDAPIKEGDWFINISGVWKHNGIIEPESTARKIILTTDPKLIKGWIKDNDPEQKSDKTDLVTMMGVPAIDGNTKATITFYIQGGIPQFKDVNFLTEFCKRWNDKADMVIEVEMEEVKHQFSLNSSKHPTSHFQIKLDTNKQPTLIFK